MTVLDLDVDSLKRRLQRAARRGTAPLMTAWQSIPRKVQAALTNTHADWLRELQTKAEDADTIQDF